MAAMTVLSFGARENLMRPCADCGLHTGCFCDYCLAACRLPNEDWEIGQRTPLCETCDRKHDGCHGCRGEQWCMPPSFPSPADIRYYGAYTSMPDIEEALSGFNMGVELK